MDERDLSGQSAEGWPQPPGVYSASADPAAPAAQEPSRPRWKAPAIGAIVVAVVVVGSVVGVVSTRGTTSVPGSGMAPAAYVVTSTQTTLGQHTAHVDITGSLSAQGQSLPVSGTGAADFDTNSFSADFTMSTTGHSIDEQELAIGPHLYIGVSADGQDMSAITGGAHFIDVPVPDQGSGLLGAGNVDPMTQLKVLAQRGSTVVPLGTSTIDGTTVSGYAVTPTLAEEQQELQKELASGTIPQTLAPDVQRALQTIGTPTTDVYIDSSNLLREISVTIGSSSSAMSGTVKMAFSDYGTPVSIEPPASSDVISYSDFVQDLQQLGSSAGSTGSLGSPAS